MKNFTLTVCASGGGGNFQALIDAQDTIGFKIKCLVTDRDCGAVDRAKINGIPVRRLGLTNTTLVEDYMSLIPEDSNLIVLAGFMPIVPKEICDRWIGKIINTHPSLLPKFGGKGMYGVKVQEAVMAAGEKVAGCTVHFVNSEIDGGDIIMQKSITVNYKQTPWELGGRVFIEENRMLVEAVKLLMHKEIIRRSL